MEIGNHTLKTKNAPKNFENKEVFQELLPNLWLVTLLSMGITMAIVMLLHTSKNGYNARILSMLRFTGLP